MGASRVLEQVQAGSMTLSREVVSRIDGEGRVFLRASEDGAPEIACDVLAGSAGREPAVSAGQSVLVAWAASSGLRPVVLGTIAGCLTPAAAGTRFAHQATLPGKPEGGSEERIEAKKIHVSASEELVLECGPALIRITADGKIVIRGEHVLSRARGTQRIKGGSVAIN